MEIREAEAITRKTVEIRSVNLAAEARKVGEAQIVGDYDLVEAAGLIEGVAGGRIK